MVRGGEALEEAEKEKAQEQRKLQLELEQERLRQQALIEERQQAEEQMLEKERQYNSLQEEVEEQREIIKKLRQKYKQAESELKAATLDQGDVRAELTDTIRAQEKDLDFLNAVVSMMLKDGEMYRLKEKVKYDFDAGKWQVPPFLVKNKEVNFPRIKNAISLVKEELDQRELVIAETGEVISDRDPSDSGSKYGSNGIQQSFKQNNKRSRKRVDKLSSGLNDGDSNGAGFMKVPSPPPFRNGASRSSGQRNGSIEDGGSPTRLNNEYYASGARGGLNDRASSSDSGKYQSYKGGSVGNHQSSIQMARNDSDFNVQRTIPSKRANKYQSIERDRGAEENEISPMTMMKKKANVHLQPMLHKKAQMLPADGMGQGLTPMPMPIHHSESNPILSAHGQTPAIHDRSVKLEKLNHIPSMKSSLLQAQSDTMSQGNLDSVNRVGINYEAMPVGKKSVLAPINVLQNNAPLDPTAGHPAFGGKMPLADTSN